MSISAPRWDLTNVYPSLESKEFQNAVKEYKGLLDKLEKFYKSKVEEVMDEAENLSKQMDALIAFKIKTEKLEGVI